MPCGVVHGVRQALFPIDGASWGCLQLIDFGLSKHLQSAHTLGVGTPDYMYVLRYGGQAIGSILACTGWNMKTNLIKHNLAVRS